MLTAIVIMAILLIALVDIASLKPDTFSLVRSADIKAPPEKIFAQLNDFKNWAAWSPWEKMDLDMQKTFKGPPSGKGSYYSWIGNKKVGEGNMEIYHSVPSKVVELNLNFLKPFKASNKTQFALTPQGNSTHVRWEMRGPLNLFMKVMHLFMNMDKMVGKDFEAGLANLKAVAER